MFDEFVLGAISADLNYKGILLLILFLSVEYVLWLGDYINYIIGYSMSKKVVDKIVEFRELENMEIKVPAAQYFSMVEINNKNYLIKRSRMDKIGREIEIVITKNRIDCFEENIEYFLAYRTKYEVPYMDFQQKMWHFIWLLIIPLIFKIFL